MIRRWTVRLLALTAWMSAVSAFAQPAPVSDQFSFAQAILTNSAITNFQLNAQITLAAGQTINVHSNLFVDGGSNNVIFSGGQVARIFHVFPKATLTLWNVQLYDGAAAAGGAIYNEGSLVVSNCALGGNNATNVSGAAGGTRSSSGNGTDGGPGAPATGGAIYSTGSGSLVVLYSTLTNNFARAGNGGNGGNGAAQFLFADNGGSGGAGAPANGGAIYSASLSNYIYACIFQGDECLCGAGGLAGSPGSARFSGVGGSGGAGASGAGGAIYCQRRLTLGASFLQDNGVSAGASGPGGANNFDDGASGGSAIGGAIYLGSGASGSLVTNCTILGNYCIAGAGGGTATSAHAGGGGSVFGAGLASQAPSTQVLYCTVATNLLTPGQGGTNTAGGSNGSTGASAGSQVYAAPGAIRLAGSILSGGAPGSGVNATGVADAGFNLSSDTVPISQADSLANRNPFLSVSVASVIATTNVTTNGVLVTSPTYPTTDFVLPVVTNFLVQSNLTYPSGLAFFDLSTNTVLVDDIQENEYIYELITGYSYTNTGSLTNITYNTNFFAAENGGPTPTLAMDTSKSPAVNDITGVPGISFPLTDQRLYYRVSPTTIGAFDPFAVAALSVTNGGHPAEYQIVVQNGGINLPSVFQDVTNYAFLTLTNGTTNLTFFDPQADVTTNFGYTTNVTINLTSSNVPPSFTNYFASDIPVPIIAGLNPHIIGLGQTATLTATVSSNVPGLGYQWQFNGINLTNNASYQGVTTSNLDFRNITAKAAGTYSVIAGTTLFYTRTSSVVVVDVQNLSKVVFTAPAANARTGAAAVRVRGTFTEAGTVTNIDVWITNLNTGLYTNIVPDQINFGRSSGNFLATAYPLPGTNLLAAWAEDSRGPGFDSLTVTRKFFSIAPTPLAVTINPSDAGAGTASIRDGAKLDVGQTYTIVARPTAKWVFSNWSASTNGGAPQFISDSPTLRFEMESNLALTANFASNVFLPSVGTYNGLFYSTNTNASAPIGIISGLALARTGGYSAKFFALGLTTNVPISGVFGVSNGVATNSIADGTNSFSVAMTFANGVIVGAVSNTAGASQLRLERTVKTNLTAAYTLLLLPQDANSNSPLGNGYALLTNRQGNVVLSGTLADGTAFSQSVGVSGDGVVPLYAPLYSAAGAITGWLTPQGLSESNLLWIKPATSSLYPAGFTNILGAQGARWIAPKSGALAVPSLAGGGILTFSNGYLAAPIDFGVNLAAGGRLTAADTSAGSLLGSVNPKNGLLTLTLTNDLTLTTAHGVLLQTAVTNGIIGGGYFLTSSNSGTMILTTNGP